MYKNKKIAVIVPAYNEELLIRKTIESVPFFVDTIVAVNDVSTDNTLSILNELKKKNKKLTVITNPKNGGVGSSIKAGLKCKAAKDNDYFVVMAGDAQMDPAYLPDLLDTIIDKNYDFVKANRFKHADALKKMPKYRKLGNIIVTVMTKFATGYYSIFDTQNGYVVYSKYVVENLPYDILSDRYDYENTVLIGLSIIGARVGDVAVPAVYGDEKSTINLLPTVMKTMHSLFTGFWRRVYYKYVLYNFHPIALLLFGGLLMFILSLAFTIFILVERIFYYTSPTSGTVMLAVLPILIGFQMLMSALIMDVNNEDK